MVVNGAVRDPFCPTAVEDCISANYRLEFFKLTSWTYLLCSLASHQLEFWGATLPTWPFHKTGGYNDIDCQ